jgi:predicted lipoprotein with Yx(FWY)xxD motif
MFSFKKLVAMPIMAAILVAGCSSAAATAVPTQAPTDAPATPTAAVAGVSSAPAGGATVMAAATGAGTVLVAASNGMTVYNFSSDTANSGTSACSGGCAAKWPPLTVPAGTTPGPGTGATGTLGTITRADTGALQVTYNGLPLYFYSGDHAAGDTNGNYPGWSPVKP